MGFIGRLSPKVCEGLQHFEEVLRDFHVFVFEVLNPNQVVRQTRLKRIEQIGHLNSEL
jgi:hypothetical protein